MRYWIVMMAMTAAVGGAAGSRNAEIAAQWADDGRFHFLACEFKEAAHAFENSVAQQPENAEWRYWLGKTYSRMAEVSGLFTATKNARKAQRNLEEAVKLDPRNAKYLEELFDFYVDSPEWFHGGLERAAALLERMPPEADGAQVRLAELTESRNEHNGFAWWMRMAILRTTGATAFLVP